MQPTKQHFQQQNFKEIDFPTEIEAIIDRIKAIQPERYAHSRNYAEGSVTKLSPYISRGVISSRKVYTAIESTGIEWEKAKKLIQELAWRDYWQQVWIYKGDGIHEDLKRPQHPVRNYEIPTSVISAQTGITAVDEAIQGLYNSGYMHNHMRMYVASICCNIAQCHWSEPAKWLYAHLLDGDIASNQLNWQWVCGSNANKKYYANQDNINKYWKSNQKNTFLDVDYDRFEGMNIPTDLQLSQKFNMHPPHVTETESELENSKITVVYNYYNLDNDWMTELECQRVLLIEPSIFKQFIISQKCMRFMVELAQNIPNIQIFVGEFSALKKKVGSAKIHFKEHPLNAHYTGIAHPREWISDTKGYYSSFFGFWKKCEKQIRW